MRSINIQRSLRELPQDFQEGLFAFGPRDRKLLNAGSHVLLIRGRVHLQDAQGHRLIERMMFGIKVAPLYFRKLWPSCRHWRNAVVPLQQTCGVFLRAQSWLNWFAVSPSNQGSSARIRSQKVHLQLAHSMVFSQAHATLSTAHEPSNWMHFSMNSVHMRTFSSKGSAGFAALHTAIGLLAGACLPWDRFIFFHKASLLQAVHETHMSGCNAEFSLLYTDRVFRGSTKESFPITSMVLDDLQPPR